MRVIQLVLKFGGEEMQITMNESSTVAELKNVVAYELGVTQSNQKLTLRGKRLYIDDVSLKVINAVDMDVVAVEVMTIGCTCIPPCQTPDRRNGAYWEWERDGEWQDIGGYVSELLEEAAHRQSRNIRFDYGPLVSLGICTLDFAKGTLTPQQSQSVIPIRRGGVAKML